MECFASYKFLCIQLDWEGHFMKLKLLQFGTKKYFIHSTLSIHSHMHNSKTNCRKTIKMES